MQIHHRCYIVADAAQHLHLEHDKCVEILVLRVKIYVVLVIILPWIA